jgi:hypothetical protein
VIAPDGLAVSPDKARWLGRWSGYACRNRQCDNKLLVQKVSSEGANIVFVMAGPLPEAIAGRVEATFVGQELRATLANGATLTYRIRDDRALEMMWRHDAYWVAGVLSKTNQFALPLKTLTTNPFDGVWEVVAVSQGKEFPWGLRIAVDGRGGTFYPERRTYAGTGDAVCRGTRTSIRDIEFNDTTMALHVRRSELVAGGEDFHFFFQKQGDEAPGFGQMVDSRGRVVWFGSLLARRP